MKNHVRITISTLILGAALLSASLVHADNTTVIRINGVSRATLDERQTNPTTTHIWGSAEAEGNLKTHPDHNGFQLRGEINSYEVLFDNQTQEPLGSYRVYGWFYGEILEPDFSASGERWKGSGIFNVKRRFVPAGGGSGTLVDFQVPIRFIFSGEMGRGTTDDELFVTVPIGDGDESVAYRFKLDTTLLVRRSNGDLNYDGCFDSSDLVIAFRNGPSVLDFNGDGSYTDDLVRLFQRGTYERCN